MDRPQLWRGFTLGVYETSCRSCCGPWERPNEPHSTPRKAAPRAPGHPWAQPTYVSECSSAPVPLQLVSGSAAYERNPRKVFGPCHIPVGPVISTALADTSGRGRSGSPPSILCSETLTPCQCLLLGFLNFKTQEGHPASGHAELPALPPSLPLQAPPQPCSSSAPRLRDRNLARAFSSSQKSLSFPVAY